MCELLIDRGQTLLSYPYTGFDESRNMGGISFKTFEESDLLHVPR